MADFYLFDTLSGGAGYATQIGQHIESLLSLTQDILTNCPDECERSCYRCLRTYANRILHNHLDRHLAGTLLQAIISGHAPVTPSIEQQIRQLDALRQFLDLVGVACQRGGVLQGVNVPMQVKTAHQIYAVGTYPVQQERELVKHPLDVLPNRQVRLSVTTNSCTIYQRLHSVFCRAYGLLVRTVITRTEIPSMPSHLELACMIVWCELQEDHSQFSMRHAPRLLDGPTSGVKQRANRMGEVVSMGSSLIM